MALQVQSCLLPSRAMRERNVIVRDIVEEMDLVLLQQKTGSNRMYWSIAPAFVEEPTILVKRLKVIKVCLGAEPIEVTNFEIRPLI